MWRRTASGLSPRRRRGAGSRRTRASTRSASAILRRGRSCCRRIPVNADTWAAAAARMSEPVQGPRPAGARDERRRRGPWGDWLTAVTDGRDDLHLVGHSVGAAVAVEHASQHPEQVRMLTLVAPAFLQPAPGMQQRMVPLTSAYFRFASATSLARKLLGAEEYAGALETSVIDLRRPGVARRVGRLLARGARKRQERSACSSACSTIPARSTSSSVRTTRCPPRLLPHCASWAIGSA